MLGGDSGFPFLLCPLHRLAPASRGARGTGEAGGGSRRPLFLSAPRASQGHLGNSDLPVVGSSLQLSFSALAEPAPGHVPSQIPSSIASACPFLQSTGPHLQALNSDKPGLCLVPPCTQGGAVPCSCHLHGPLGPQNLWGSLVGLNQALC